MSTTDDLTPEQVEDVLNGADVPAEADVPTLDDQALMGADPVLRDRVTAALAGKAMEVASAGRPPADADRAAMVSWGLAQRVLSPATDDVSRALWAIATLPGGPVTAYAAADHDAGALSDEVLVAAVTVVWPSLAGT